MNRKTVIAAVAATVALGSFGEIRALRHDPWGGQKNSWQMKRHAEKMGVVTNGGAKVVFVGDSITHFWETYGSQQLEKYFSAGEMKMLNLGYGGDRTEHLLWRLNEGGELDGYTAKCVLLMIGTNNTGHFPVDKEPPVDTILGIREVLRTIRAKQPSAAVVLTAIFPRGRDPKDAARRRNELVNKEIRAFADGRHVFWCDFNEQFLTLGGRLSPEIFPDCLHPADRGYEIWYAAVKPYIDYALSDGRLPVPPHRFAPFQRPETLIFDEPVPASPISRIRAVRGDDWTDPWLDRIQAMRNAIADAKGEVAAAYLAGGIAGGLKATAGADALAAGALDLSIADDGIEHVIWRAENGVLDGYKAKRVFLLAGANGFGYPIEQVEQGVVRLLGLLKRKQPQAEVVLVPLAAANAADGKGAKLAERFNAMLKAHADGKRVKLP